MANEDNNSATLTCLQHAIADSQATIRAYDTKAEVLGILLTVAIGMTNFTILQQPAPCSKLLLEASWLAALLAIGFLGAVLKPRKDLFSKIQYGGYTPNGTYFIANLSSGPQNTVTQLAKKAESTDWVCELMFENMKLSLIREYKHRWFFHALWLSGLALFLIAISVFVGV
jgi:hypothetical protein